MKFRIESVCVCWALAVVCCLFVTCGNENELDIRSKLDIICRDDLATVADDIAAEDRIDPVYFTMVLFKRYSEGKYTYMAVVDFFFLKKVPAKMVRKYRYHSKARKWERYFNQYQFVNDSPAAKVL
jgi:hypothetical protein